MHFVMTIQLKRLINLLWLLGLTVVGFSQNAQIPRPDIPVEIEFSEPGGFFAEEVVVELNSPGADIYYSLDGTTPTKKSTLYEFPLLLLKQSFLQLKAETHIG